MKREYKGLVKRLLSGKITSQDKQELTEWEAVETEMKKQWYNSDQQTPDDIVKLRMWANIKRKCKPETHGKRFHITPLRAIAALFLLIIATGGIYLSYRNMVNADEYIEIVADEDKMYLLPDSSRVWMHAGSSIRFPEKFNQKRDVWLTGNSLFDVYKHEGPTFKVHINKAFIEVKGTSFLIKQETKETEIILFNGKIDLNIKPTKDKLSIAPMQRVIYNPENSQVEYQNMDNIKWEEGRYKFTDIPLKDLIQTINTMYNTDIMVDGKINREVAFTGTIRYDETLEEVLNKISFSLNLKIKSRQNSRQIILY